MTHLLSWRTYSQVAPLLDHPFLVAPSCPLELWGSRWVEEEGVCSETHTNTINHNDTCTIQYSIWNAWIPMLYLFLWLIHVHPFLCLFIPHNLKNRSIFLIKATKQDKPIMRESRMLLEVGAYRFVLVVWQMCFVLSFWNQPGQPAATRSLMKNEMQHSFQLRKIF